jgi:hypothetical protein
MKTLEAQEGVVTRLESQLDQERMKLEQLKAARAQYEETIRPHTQAGREAVETAIPQLQEWRRDFNAAVESFDTAGIGSLGVRLRDVQAELFPAIEEAYGAAWHSKRRELGFDETYEGRLDATGPSGAAAAAVLQEIGARDPRLNPFQDVKGKTGENFARMIMDYCTDQQTRIYNPGAGSKNFTS